MKAQHLPSLMPLACPVALKPHLSTSEQLALMASRGMLIANPQAAQLDLLRLGYYRLSGYYYPLRQTRPVGINGRLDSFVEGTTFDLVIELADFDKRLRLLALDAVESVEVAIRVAIAHRLGKLHPLAHLTPTLLDRRFTEVRPGQSAAAHDEWIRRFNTVCTKSKEDFHQHHLQIYGGQMPIWAAIELWDFGLLSRFYEGLQQPDRDAIARQFAPVEGPVLVNWLKTFNFVRNVAAHHSRLWNRTLPDVARLPPLESCPLLQPLHRRPEVRRKLFAAFTCLRLLLKRIQPTSTWHEQVQMQLARFPKTPLLSLSSAGFEDGWQTAEVWK